MRIVFRSRRGQTKFALGVSALGKKKGNLKPKSVSTTLRIGNGSEVLVEVRVSPLEESKA